ncbi:MAG TPA: FAD-dependent oxidoreductase [Actinophytocola sp.]|nr:FAD-dependent oxidoreductase [Actinophytocola sp.]
MTAFALPGEPAYNAATAVFNLSAPPQPDAAVTARSVDDVRTAVEQARRVGTTLRVHTTGHAAGAVRPVRASALVRTELAGEVEVDAERRIARVPAGTRWEAVVDATAPYGLMASHGSSGTVGVVGYVLRGGLSPYGRAVGLAANALRAIELVTADGELRRVDAESDPELFWALRGGGGGFGVVTAVELELFPLSTVITGMAVWSGSDAERLFATWLNWTSDAPLAATTSVRVMNLPDVPDVPPELAGKTTFAVDGLVHATSEDQLDDVRGHAEDLLGPLRAAATPLIDTWQETVPSAVLKAHMDPDDPVPILGDHLLLDELDDIGAGRLLDTLGEGSPLVVAGLRQLGGAYATPSRPGGALDRLDAAFSYGGSGLVFEPAHAEAIREHGGRLRAAMSPWDTGRTVPGFVEDFDQPQGHLTAEQVARVRAVRTRVDPDGLFRDDVAPGEGGVPQ